MGRHRINPEGLPKRVYLKHGAYHYVHHETGVWHRLGERWDREAKDKYAQLSSGHAAGGSVSALLDAYYGVLGSRLAKGKLSPRHYKDRAADAERLKTFFGHMQAAAVKRKHISLYLMQRTDKHGKHAPVRANREISMLSAAYNWDANLDTNPCLRVPKNEEDGRDRYVSHSERRMFAKLCPPWLRAYLLLKYLVGLRQGDMLKLHRMMEKPKGLEVVIGKNKRSRQVLLFGWTWALRTVVDAIHTLTPPTTTAYFPATGGTSPLTAAGFKSAWRRSMAIWKDKGNEPFWEHDIRAKNASDSDNERDAQERLGHADVKTTRKHYLRGPGRIKRVSPLH